MPELNLYTGFRNNGTIANWRGHARFTAQRGNGSDPNVYCTMECWDERSGGDSTSWEGEWAVRYRVYMRFDGPGGPYGDRDTWSGTFTSNGSAQRGVISWSQNVPIGAQINNIWCSIYCEVNGGGYNDASGWMPMSGFNQYNPTPTVTWEPATVTSITQSMTTASPTLSLAWYKTPTTPYNRFQIVGYVAGQTVFSRILNRSYSGTTLNLNKWEVNNIISAMGSSTTTTMAVDLITQFDGNGYGMINKRSNVTVTKNSSLYKPSVCRIRPQSGGVVHTLYPKVNLSKFSSSDYLYLCNTGDTTIPNGHSTWNFLYDDTKGYEATQWGMPYNEGILIQRDGLYTIHFFSYFPNRNQDYDGYIGIRRNPGNRMIMEQYISRQGSPYMSASIITTQYLKAGEKIFTQIGTASATAKTYSGIQRLIIMPVWYSNLALSGV